MISDKKFIELLNLYLDHEISAEEVRVLEAEIMSSPARHTLYRQYCAMHKGCLELASTFAPQPEQAVAGSASSTRQFAHNREAPPSVRDKFGWGAWVGGLGLAAACGALAFFVFSHKHHQVAAPGGVPAPALLAVPLASPLNIPTPSPVASAPHLGPHAGEARTLLAGGGDSGNVAAHAFVTAAEMALSAPAPKHLHAVYTTELPHSHSAAPFRFSAIYTTGPTAMERGHLDWGPLVDLREMMEGESTQPTFQVRPAVAPNPRVYRRQERRFEGGRVEMTRFQFQR